MDRWIDGSVDRAGESESEGGWVGVLEVNLAEILRGRHLYPGDIVDMPIHTVIVVLLQPQVLYADAKVVAGSRCANDKFYLGASEGTNAMEIRCIHIERSRKCIGGCLVTSSEN